MTSNRIEHWLGRVRPQTVLVAMSAIVVLTLLGGYLYVVAPSLVRLQALEAGNTSATVEALRDEAAETGLEITESQSVLAEIRSEIYGGPSDQPPEKVESYIVDRLDRLSVRHAVELVSVEPGEARSVLMFDELQYEVEVKGEFLALTDWLGEIEDELRPLVVNGFDLRPASPGPRIQMKLRLASYRPQRDFS